MVVHGAQRLSYTAAVVVKIALWLALAAAVLYVAVLVWFKVKEDALLFHPDASKLVPAPANLHLESQDVSLKTTDGLTLWARLIPPLASAAEDAAPWILYFHGASGNVGTLGYNDAWSKFRRVGFGVLAIDYRGYGESQGQPSEQGFYRDADAAYAYLTQTLKVPASRVVIYGYSLGSAVAIDLATRAPAAGLVVEGALLSVPDRGAELYPYFPIRWLAKNRFASVDKIRNVTMPKLFIHARNDIYVPLAHGQRLFELAVPPKQLQAVDGGHTDAYVVDPTFFSGVIGFAQSLGLSVRNN